MKQILTILILGLISIGKVFAQDAEKVNYQLDFGTTLTIPYEKTIEIMPEVAGHPQTNYNTNFGYFFETLISYNLNSRYSISSGLNFNLSSLKINDKAGIFENKGNLENLYLTFPVLIKYRLSNKIPVTISTGPYIGLLISAYEKGTTYIDTTGLTFTEPDPVFETIDLIQKYNTNTRKDYTTIDYGVSIQLDYDIKLSQGLKGIVLTRLNYGIKNVLTNKLENKSLADYWKNYSLMIGFGLKI